MLELIQKKKQQIYAVVIVCDNTVDMKSLKGMLGIKKKKSYKNSSVGESRVLWYSEFKKKLNELIAQGNIEE